MTCFSVLLAQPKDESLLFQNYTNLTKTFSSFARPKNGRQNCVKIKICTSSTDRLYEAHSFLQLLDNYTEIVKITKTKNGAAMTNLR